MALACALTCELGKRYLVLADSIMIHVLGVVLASARFGVAASLFTAGVSMLSFDFFFLPPAWSFAVPDVRSFITFASMSVVALVISRKNQLLRASERSSRIDQAHTASLYAMTRDLAAARTAVELAEVARQHLERIAHAPVTILLPDAEGHLVSSSSARLLDDELRAAAERVWTTSSAREWEQTGVGLFARMLGTKERLGLVVLRGVAERDERPRSFDLEDLTACTQQLAVALDRAARSRDVERAQLQVETERLRGALLSSISHDLRTPLTAILTAGTTLSQDHATLAPRTRTALASVVVEEAERLSSLVTNLLSMTRLDSGPVQIKKISEPLEEVVGAALHRLEARLEGRAVCVEAPAEVPLVAMDAMLIEQVLLNVLENAIRYSPAGSPIDLRLVARDGVVELEVRDRGVGLAHGEEKRVFEKFYRGARAVNGDGGVGLGLTICQAIVSAHGGSISIENRKGGGATVRMMLPAEPFMLEPSALPELTDVDVR